MDGMLSGDEQLNRCAQSDFTCCGSLPLLWETGKAGEAAGPSRQSMLAAGDRHPGLAGKPNVAGMG
jgi:hypothetical protein